MVEPWLFLVPLLFSLAHILGLVWDVKNKKYIQYLRSFSAGFSVAYVFLILLPEATDFDHLSFQGAMIYVLTGFVFFHIAHKFIFRTRDPGVKTFLLDETHLITAAVYNFLVTFSLVELIQVDFAQGILVTGLISIHTILSELAHAEPIQDHISKSKVFVIIASIFLGGMFAIYEFGNHTLNSTVFSITVGAMIYISIREEIPDDSHGQVWFFVAGSMILPLIQAFFLVN